MIDNRILISISLRAALLLARTRKENSVWDLLAKQEYPMMMFIFLFFLWTALALFFSTLKIRITKTSKTKWKDQPSEISSFRARISLLTQLNWNWASLLADFKVFSSNIWHCLQEILIQVYLHGPSYN